MALITNKKASLSYTIGEKMTAGVELFGFEVKSLRSGLGSLEGSYIIVRGGEAFLIGGYIPPFQKANSPKDYNDRRNRKLLLKKEEIKKIGSLEKQKISFIPLSFFTSGTKIKLEFAIATGKQKKDKRQSIKKRDVERDIKRKL